MTFVSLAFMVFVAVSAALYFTIPVSKRWIVLLAASYVFYFINSRMLVLVLFVSTLITYLTAGKIAGIAAAGKNYLKENDGVLSKEEKKKYRADVKKKSRNVLVLGTVVMLGILAAAKYYNFFAVNVNLLLVRIGFTLPRLNLLLPLGISFYTLQAVGYMIDVYRGKQEPETNLFRFMLFMSFFPQIVQGPIPRYRQLADQLYEGHSFDLQRILSGIQLILWGLMKKLILADRVGAIVSGIYDFSDSYTGLILFAAGALYGVQVYADFSGGMDIARGVSQIFGIELELNFRQPYHSSSVEEFWRRWHITLGGWMRDYVFYPLSLSKTFASLSKKSRERFGASFGKKLPSFLSMFIVYFLVGIWHGPNWKYIAYGIWNGIFIVCGILFAEQYASVLKKCGIDEETESWKFFRMFRTFVIITFGRYFSRAAGLFAALRMFKNTFIHWYDLSWITNGSLTAFGVNTANWAVIIVGIAVVLWVDHLHEKGIRIRERISAQPLVFRWLIYIGAVVCILVFGIYGPSYNAAVFIYEQF